VGIAREIFEYIFRPLNGVSDIYYPVASIKAVHQRFEPGGSSQRSGLARESEGSPIFLIRKDPIRSSVQLPRQLIN